MTTQQDLRHQIPARLDVDAAVPSYSKAMSHLDTTATREPSRIPSFFGSGVPEYPLLCVAIALPLSCPGRRFLASRPACQPWGTEPSSGSRDF